MSLMPRQPCHRCKPIVEGLERALARNTGAGAFTEAVKLISNMITEEPGPFLDMLPPDVRAALIAEALKRKPA